MSVLEVRRVDDVFGVVMGDGTWRPIEANGGPVRQFLAGWSPARVIDVFAPLHMLSLQHRDGAEATWILDSDMRRLSDTIARIPDRDRPVLRERAEALLGQVFDQIITAPRIGRSDDSDDLALLCDTTIIELVVLAASARAPVTVIRLEDPDADAALDRFDLRATNLRATLSGSLPEAFRHRMQYGALPRPSPFDGRPMDAEIGLPLTDRLTAYRFVDRARQLTIYLLTQDYHDCTTGLYIPKLGLYCTSGISPDIHTLLGLLLVHATRHQQRLLRYLSTPSHEKVAVNFVSDYPTLHIGHVVWNELSGLQELIDTLDAEFLPLVCVLNSSNGSEAYGPLDSLFPEYVDKVVRPDVRWLDAAALIYDSGWFFMRYMTRYVPSRVGERIQALLADDPVLSRDRGIARRLFDEGRSCVLLGLRVGNRTLADLGGFLVDAIDHLTDRLGRLTIVIDGINNRLGLDATTSYASFGPAAGEELIIEELRLVFELRRRYSVTRDVEIISTVGAPIACGLFWAAQSRFFVAPWGAALAKYRWVCNRPGFVVTNRANLAARQGDLLIYNDPRFVEAPSPMRFVEPDFVSDAPGPSGFRANFRIDRQGLQKGIDELIDLTTPS
ncbi:hypothetical protein [Lichenicoccus sp.]|uniref:hypothetical protein n=1 Tax=Lichenicoccus sp. TaxID=2781899 RepID=UPI003D0EAD0F